MAQWFLVRDGQEQGPITDQQLNELAKKGELQPNHRIRRADMEKSVMAAKVQGLVFGNVAIRTSPVIQPPTQNHGQPLIEEKRLNPNNMLLLGTWVGIGLCCTVFTFLAITGRLGPFVAWLENANKPTAEPVQEGPTEPASTPEEKTTDEAKTAPPKSVSDEANKEPPSEQPKRDEPLDLAKGRPPIDELISNLKRFEDLEVHTPKEGNSIDGTPFEFLNDAVGGTCQLHIGGREKYGQNVSVLVAESNGKVGAVILGTPISFRRPVARGNDLTSLSSIVRQMLPDADVRALLGEQGLQVASGDGAKKVFGKANLNMKHEQRTQEMRVVIVIDP